MQFDLKKFSDELRYLVNVDSGSRCVEGVNQLADWFSNRFLSLGWNVSNHVTLPDCYGRSILACSTDAREFDLLILCHLDTVFPSGSAQARPFEEKDGVFTGPGVADMKAGCLMTLHALEQLQASGRLRGNLAVFFNGEHELSCPTSRPTIEALSRRAKVVVSTEPARANGACVRQRKGILRYSLKFKGRSAHSGVNPEAGICAVTEMARTIVRLKALENKERGITVNPGLVSGGQSINTVPDMAACEVDVRVVHLEDAQQIDANVRAIALAPLDSEVRIELTGGVTRPPLVPTARGDEIIAHLNAIGRTYGLELQWDFSGGGSDASFASAFGIPALCGIGPVGGGYHTDQEYLQTTDLQERLCLFRDFVEAMGQRRI